MKINRNEQTHGARKKFSRTNQLAAMSTLILTMMHGPAKAEDGNATEMWGTVQASAGGEYGGSELMHQTAGVIAGQVNAAEKGILYAGPTLTVVGSQSIVQVNGNNNVVSDINQESVNSGNVELNSQIN